jgi:hypothetical protein
MKQLGNFGNFNVRFRVVQHAVDQLSFEKFGIVPLCRARHKGTYVENPVM